MWIRFTSSGKYMIKIYVGGVNAISSEPVVEDASTKLRCEVKLAQQDRKHKQDERSSLQNYIVVPGQMWLDGIAHCDGTVRQFVAMPFGSGYSVESQITGKETAGGIRFEITPYWSLPPQGPNGNFSIMVKTLTGKTLVFSGCLSATKIEKLKRGIQFQEGIPPEQQRLFYMGI